MPNLKILDEQFKAQHFLIIDAINESDEDSLAKDMKSLTHMMMRYLSYISSHNSTSAEL